MFSDWQFVVIQGGQLWINGVKKKSPEALGIVKKAIQAWDAERIEGRGYLEKRGDEFIFHSEVEWEREPKL